MKNKQNTLYLHQKHKQYNLFRMKTEKIKLSQIKVNEANPREIRQDKFKLLVNSILVFPKMLEMRPIVIDKTHKALGGNQRTSALKEIAKMGIEEIADRLCQIPDYINKSNNDERIEILTWWSEWLDEPFAYIMRADTLTEDEKHQFVIKDNTSYGTWDYDALSSNWDSAKLQQWGMDVWNDTPTSTAEPQQPEDDPESEPDFSNLPPELQGIKLNPDDLPKIQGTDERPNDYVIITYLPEDKERLLGFLGIPQERWVEKICFTIDEIKFMKEG